MAHVQLTFETDDRLVSQLDELAARTQRDRSELLNEALGSYLDSADWRRAQSEPRQSWTPEQLAAIDEGLRQAEAGEFATDEEVEAAFREFTK